MSHVSIGHLYTALHAACASAVARVVEANAVDVSYVDLGADERDEALSSQEVDLLVSAWLPEEDALLSAGREAIGSLYLPELSFCSLAGHDVPASWTGGLFDCLIVTENAGERLEKARALRPDLGGLMLEVVGEGALMGRLEQARVQGEKPLVVAWQPHAVFHTAFLNILSDDSGVLGAPLNARIVLREGLREQIDEDLLDELSGMMLGNRVMSALDHAISVEGIDPEIAAESWQRGRLLAR